MKNPKEDMQPSKSMCETPNLQAMHLYHRQQICREEGGQLRQATRKRHQCSLDAKATMAA